MDKSEQRNIKIYPSPWYSIREEEEEGEEEKEEEEETLKGKVWFQIALHVTRSGKTAVLYSLCISLIATNEYSYQIQSLFF